MERLGQRLRFLATGDSNDPTDPNSLAYNPTCSNDHLITSLPGLSTILPCPMYAGHLPVDTTTADSPTIRKGRKLFYWMVRAGDENGEPHASDGLSTPPSNSKLPPLLIWLNGGPACSSMDGLFIENGPVKVSMNGESFTVTPNEYSWHKAGLNVVYIDQPVGTGLSFLSSTTQYGGYPTNDAAVNKDFYGFLLNFLDLHDDLKGRELWFSGESHAGHYIPSMMDYIMEENAKLEGGEANGGSHSGLRSPCDKRECEATNPPNSLLLSCFVKNAPRFARRRQIYQPCGGGNWERLDVADSPVLGEHEGLGEWNDQYRPEEQD